MVLYPQHLPIRGLLKIYQYDCTYRQIIIWGG